jgi:hypothetical protein
VPAFAIEQPSPSCHGVARPCALSGLAGTASEQFIDAAACAAVWVRLMALPVPSTGAVATSPSCLKAVWPLAKEFAGATAAPVPVPVAVALAAALALALADAVGAGCLNRNAD